ncbi:major facilitator superfamily transporter [Apiospora saccharicola]
MKIKKIRKTNFPLSEFCEDGKKADDSPVLPRQWLLWKKVTTSMFSLFPVATIMYTTTSLSTAVPTFPALFATSKTLASLSFSIPFLGMTSAPLYTPYLSERFGRKPVLLLYFFLYVAVVIGLTFANTIPQLLLLRFLIGLLGGPCIVMAEGTLSQLWSPKRRMTYYAVLSFTQYVGAAAGWLVGVVVLQVLGLPYLSITALLYASLSLGILLFVPETCARKILKKHMELDEDVEGWWRPAALWAMGVELVRDSILKPLWMLVRDPIVIVCSLYLALNYAIVFQFFISGPLLLRDKYGFTFAQTSLAFVGMLVGSMLSLTFNILVDFLGAWKGPRDAHGKPRMENRLLPALTGGIMLSSALFAVGFTVNARDNVKLVLTGIVILTWGTMDILVSLVSYVSDAYSRQHAMTAITAMAFARYFSAGIMPCSSPATAA